MEKEIFNKEKHILNKIEKIKSVKKFKKEFEIFDRSVYRSNNDKIKRYDISIGCRDKKGAIFYLDLSNYILEAGEHIIGFFKIKNKKLLDLLYIDIANEYERTHYKPVFEKLKIIDDILKKGKVDVDEIKDLYDEITELYDPPNYQPVLLLTNKGNLHYTELERKFIEIYEFITISYLILSFAYKEKNNKNKNKNIDEDIIC